MQWLRIAMSARQKPNNPPAAAKSSLPAQPDNDPPARKLNLGSARQREHVPGDGRPGQQAQGEGERVAFHPLALFFSSMNSGWFFLTHSINSGIPSLREKDCP